MHTNSTGRPAGKTGPVAHAVMSAIRGDLFLSDHGREWRGNGIWAVGSSWIYGVRELNTVGKYHHVSAKHRDQDVNGRFAGNGAYE